MLVDYDEGYRPPAPVIRVGISHLTGERVLSHLAEIDTGADISVLPRHVKDDLSIPVNHVERCIMADGKVCELDMAYFKIKMDVDGTVYEERVLGGIADSQTFLLGRDFLNKLKITLDGPEEELTIH